MNVMKIQINWYLWTGLIVISIGCTDLEVVPKDLITGSEYINEAKDQLRADISLAPGYLEDAYSPLYQNMGERNIYALQESPTDEMVTPTRGTDWGDNGVWVALHQHTWNYEHIVIRNGWNDLLNGEARAESVLYYFDLFSQGDVDFQERLVPYVAEAKALRAYYMWQFVDLFGIVMKKDGIDAVVLSRSEGTDFVISELEAAIPNMFSKEDNIGYGRAVKQTAEAILAKVYLNRFIYNGQTFAPASDMDKVIELCNSIINSGEYELEDDYFGMFDQDNENSTETLLVLQNSQEQFRGFNSQTRILMTLHYSQKGGGAVPLEPWNGMCVPPDFVYRWDTDGNTSNGIQTNDDRFRDTRYLASTGIPLGFLIGQQVDKNGNNLSDRKGNPLSYTIEIGNLTQATEFEGTRVIKWAPDPDTQVQVWGDNDVALIRYADVILMKAEAQWRKGSTSDALATLNQLRAQRGATSLTTISADGQEILNERGFELYWEGHRRNDLIRFDKFAKGTWWAKEVTEDFRNLYPIPRVALSANIGLLEQNPGY